MLTKKSALCGPHFTRRSATFDTCIWSTFYQFEVCGLHFTNTQNRHIVAQYSVYEVLQDLYHSYTRMPTTVVLGVTHVLKT